MNTYEFTLRLSRAVTDDEIEALYEAGCDDGAVETGPRGALIAFDREADCLLAALISAIRDVERVPGLDVIGVERDDSVTLADVARRLGRSRESIRLLATGQRGPGGFPEPVVTTPSGERIWDWPYVACWFRDALGDDVDVPPHELTVLDQVLAARSAMATEPEPARAMLRDIIAA